MFMQFRRQLVIATLLGGMLPASALAADCAVGGQALALGNVAAVPAGGARSFSIDLKAGQGVIVDLSNLTTAAAAASDQEDEHEHGEVSAPKSRALMLCGATGARLAPQIGEVFEKGGSVSDTTDGERLRFVAPAAGKYVIGVAAGDAPREILARARDLGTGAGVVSARLGSTQDGKVSSASPQVFSFTATPGQWVELKATSSNDTVLNLAGPARDGSYSVIAKNDDSDGLNPMLRRRLANGGTYYVQVDSLGSETADFTLSLKTIPAPAPLAAPATLRIGSPVNDKLADGDAVKIYALPVQLGHSYRLELTAAYDGVVAVGLPNPIETDEGNGQDVGFSDVKSQDEGTSGTEKLTFTARSSGQLLVRVKSFGIGETDGAFTLNVFDLGG